MLTYWRVLERMHEEAREMIDDTDWDAPGPVEEMEVNWVQPGPSSEIPEGEGGLPDLPF